jgi:peptidoglycan/LPS O-acetylase OafA/YrhL
MHSEAAHGRALTSFLPQLDGLRGLAILAVIAYHAESSMLVLGWHWFTGFGWSGVDLFFVLSGFLITRILFGELQLPGITPRDYYLRFYARRALRIWPLYYAFLLVVIVFGSGFFPELEALHSTHPWPYYVLYLQNLVFMGLFPLQFTWSLAVEEQFYLVWPAVVRMLNVRRVAVLAMSGLVVAPLARAWAVSADINYDAIAVFPLTRLDGLLWGALIACAVQHSRFTSPVLTRLGVIAVLGGIVLGALPVHQTVIRFSAFSMAYAGILAMALSLPPTTGVLRPLNWSFLRYTGKVSYCMYIAHLAVMRIVENIWTRQSGGAPIDSWLPAIALFAAQLAGIYLVAAISWRYFESPILTLKRHFPYARPVNATST